MKQSKVIGLTGNSGTGKSAVSEILNENGGYIIDADKIAHTIIQPRQAAYDEIIKFFGTEILNESLTIDRKKLATIVFNDKSSLERLNDITHKYIVQNIKAEIKKNKYSEKYKYIVVDAPLLIETGLHKFVDEVWVVFADLETRIKRIIKRDNIDRDMVIARFKNQTNFDELKKYADVIIDNSTDDIEVLKKNIRNMLL